VEPVPGEGGDVGEGGVGVGGQEDVVEEVEVAVVVEVVLERMGAGVDGEGAVAGIGDAGVLCRGDADEAVGGFGGGEVPAEGAGVGGGCNGVPRCAEVGGVFKGDGVDLCAFEGFPGDGVVALGGEGLAAVGGEDDWLGDGGVGPGVVWFVDAVDGGVGGVPLVPGCGDGQVVDFDEEVAVAAGVVD